jgi:prophage regulatory protein
MIDSTTIAPSLIRMPDVLRMVSLSRPTVYRMIKAGTFPAPVQLSVSAVGWIRAEVEQWIAGRPRRGSMPKQGLTLVCGAA